MKKVRLFVCGDMVVIDTNRDTFINFHSYDRQEVVANVVKIVSNGSSHYIHTDYFNVYRGKYSKFLLNDENFARVCWVE